MPRNVEIKAKIRDITRIISIAKQLCNNDGEILKQEDIFFKVQSGRLKLRNFQVRHGDEYVSFFIFL